jgi:hypothetical protein
MTKGVSAKHQREDRLRLRRKRLQDAAGALQGAKSPVKAASGPLRGAARPEGQMTAPRSRLPIHGASLATWAKRRPWRARIYVRGRDVHLGYFASPELAREAYADAARQFGLKLKSEARP